MNKTQQEIVDVARELFAQKGRNNVTMNDIAEKAGRSRRTLYTYYNNKDEIYHAVIKHETELLYSQVLAVTRRESNPQQMLADLIVAHLKAVFNAVRRNGSLRSDFFRDIYEVERTRRATDTKEIVLIKQILRKGVAQRLFKPCNCEEYSIIIFYALKGQEVPYIKTHIHTPGNDSYSESVIRFLFSGILM